MLTPRRILPRITPPRHRPRRRRDARQARGGPIARTAVYSVPKAAPLLGGELADEQSTFRLYTFKGEDRHPSEILAKYSKPGQRLGDLYDFMLERDSNLGGLWEKRCKAVLGLPRFIVASDASPAALETARFCRQALSLVPSLHGNLAHQLQGITHGVSLEELMWERLPRGPLAGAVVPVDLIDRPMHRFTFKQGRLHLLRPHGRSEPAPPGKFLVMRHGSKDSPWGRPLLDKVYWPYKVKLHGIQYYSIFVEKFAQPVVAATYEPSKNDEADQEMEARAARIAEEIQSQYAVAFSADIAVKYIEATRGGTASYEAFLAFMSREQAIVLLGEVDTSGLGKQPGSFAKSRVSNEVRLETLAFDAHELATHLSDNLLRPMVQLNFGPDAPVPKFFIDVEEAADRELRQQGVAAVLEAGEAVGRDYFFRVHQVPPPQPGEETLRLPAGTFSRLSATQKDAAATGETLEMAA